MTSGVSRHVVDIRPLRASPGFRSWWAGSALSVFGGQFTTFALLYFVWTTTHEPALVGGVAVAEIAPTITGALVGGVLADRHDRRRLVLLTRSGQTVMAAALAVFVVAGATSIPLLFVLVALESFLQSLGAPANASFTARLLPADLLGAGLALTRLANQVSLLTGPMVAGLVTAAWGVQVCFVVDAITFLAAMYGVWRLPGMRPENAVASPDLHGLRGAVRLVATNPVLLGAFATDLAATVLAMPLALFPVINDEVYGGSAVTLGLFAPAIGLGGIVAGSLSGRVTATSRPGRLMLGGAAVWALALAGFGMSRTLWVALAALAVAGAADTVTVVSRGTIVQHVTPDSLRGRVNALDYVVGVSGPQLGNLRAGLVASATSGAASAVIGALASLLAVGVTCAATPALRRYDPDARTDPVRGEAAQSQSASTVA